MSYVLSCRMRLGLAAWCVVQSAAPASAQTPERQAPSLLLGGAAALSSPNASTLSVDPSLPRGARQVATPRPQGQNTWCAQRAPVCVHAAAADRAWAWSALSALQEAYERVVYVVQLPAPLGDGALGNGPELDLYLTPHAALPATDSSLDAPLDVVLLDTAQLSTDRASAFCVSKTAVNLATAVRCVAAASAAGLDAAETPALRDAYASAVSDWIAGPDAALLSATQHWQNNPQLNFAGREATQLTRAGRSWFTFLETQLGQGQRGVLSTALFALSRSLTSDAHPEWNNEPDVFDVLRHSLADTTKLTTLYRQFSITRLFLGQAAEAAELGVLGQVSFDWELPYSSLPRRVAGARALEPMGNSYVRVPLDSVPLGAQLGMAIEWEQPVPMLWTVIAVNAQGQEMTRWELPFLQKEQRAEHTLLNFENAAALVVVGHNLGSVDLSHPFDPDQEPWEAHAYNLYLTPLP